MTARIHDVDVPISKMYQSDGNLHKFYWNGVPGQNNRMQYVGPSDSVPATPATRSWTRGTQQAQQNSSSLTRSLVVYAGIAGILILLLQ